jgi:hypothetical protein
MAGRRGSSSATRTHRFASEYRMFKRAPNHSAMLRAPSARQASRAA